MASVYSHSQFYTPIPVPNIIDAPGASFTITGPLSTDPDRTRANATIQIHVQIRQDTTQTVANGHNVMTGVGLMDWTCELEVAAGHFEPGPAIGIASTVEHYASEHPKHYDWTQDLTFE
jgi:hypothetical protein